MRLFNSFRGTAISPRLFALAILVFGLLVLLGSFAKPVGAVPDGISFNKITPVDGATLLVSRTAANNPLDPPTFQLKADIYLNNTSGIDQVVALVTFSYPDSGINDRTYTPLSFDSDGVSSLFTIPKGDVGRVPVYDGLGRDLPVPLPPLVRIELILDLDPVPIVLEFGLAFRDNPIPLGAYFFPALASDLEAGEHWIMRTRHTVDAGGGGGTLNPSTRSQRYGYDMGVARWDGGWTELVDGAPADLEDRENDDYLIFETPLYAMADGTIVSCYRGEEDHDPDVFKNITFDNGGGNGFTIQHGNDKMDYSHMKFETIPDALCPSDGQNDGLSIPVAAGQFLGKVGNTGRSTNAHLHIHAVNVPETGPDTVNGVPIQFVNLRVLADDDTVNNLGDLPALQPLHGKTLHRNSLILPNPCGFDLPASGFLEVARHGVSAECYQDVFNLIVARGYRPVFVDGYNVGGDTFFNATFRQVGPPWVARHGLTGAQYQDLFTDLTDDGFRLHQVDSYLDGGGVRYAAIFEKRPGPAFAAFHGFTDSEYEDELDDLADAGFVPINVSTVEIGGLLFWTALFEQVAVTGWIVESVAAGDYQDTFEANVDAGRRPIYVHGFTAIGAPYLTGIWVDPIGGAWAAVHGLSSGEYQNAWNTNTGANPIRLTRAVTGYDDGGGSAHFAAVWRVRPNTTIVSTPPAVTNQTTADFGFTSNNPFTTFQCRLDSSPYSLCTSPKHLAGLSEGDHTFYVRAVDRESARDPSPAWFSWLVDVTPPVVDILIPVEDTKTVHGKFKDDEEVDITTVIGWADVIALAVDALSGVDFVGFKINGVAVPGGEVDPGVAADTWTFLFEPDEMGEQIYLIEFTATDIAANSATTSIEILGIATGKKMKP